MPSELGVHAVQQGFMEFAIDGSGHDLTVDYPLPGTNGDLKGVTPLRRSWPALRAAVGSSVAALLRRDGQPVQRAEVTARGQRRDEHPTPFTEIDLAFPVRGDVDPGLVEHAPRLSETQICPVWVMVMAGTPVSSSFTVVDG